MTREEAINEIKSWAIPSKNGREVLETLIPELSKNDDESVRKSIIHILQVGGYMSSEEKDKAFAYLEKMKEANKAIEVVDRIDKYIDENVANAHDMKDSNPDKKYYRGWDDALGEMARILQDVYSGEKQKEHKKENLRDFIDDFPYSDEQKEQKLVPFSCGHENGQPAEKQDYSELNDLERAILRGFLAAGVENVPIGIIKDTASECVRFLALTESEPVEWSEEDEGELQNAIDALEFLGKKGVYRSESGYDAALQAASWLKSLPERFNLQPKEEWSEEDQKTLDCIINVLDRLGFEEYCKSSRNQDVEEERLYHKEIQCLKKLKSLRPYWKPSEEQMEALKNSAYGAYQNGDGPALRELYEQLEKL